MSTDLVAQPQNSAPSIIPELAPLSVKDVTNRVQQIQQIMHSVMKQGVHYGRVPGTNKDSLWRPGAEILAVTFRLSTRPEIELLQEGGEIGYRTATPIYDPYDRLLTVGYGECWTTEEKFAWREAICQEEWEEWDPARRRKKWKRDYKTDEVSSILQVRQNPSDQRNAVLKRACKRSYVDAVIKALSASDIFDQQLEEDDEPQLKTKAKAATQPSQGTKLQGVIKDASPKPQGEKKPGYVVIATEAEELKLGFWENPAALKGEINWAVFKGRACTFTYEKNGKYFNLKSLELVPAPQEEEDDLPGFANDGREEDAA